MSQQNTKPQNSTERERQIAEARADLLRRAEEQGVRPLRFDEMLGDQTGADPEKENVDEFLAMIREGRRTPSRRRIE